MERNILNTRMIVVDDKQYWLQEKGFTPWVILVAVDGNEDAYVPVYRTKGDENGEFEIFSLIPAEGSGDTLLVQIRIYTQADFNADKESVSNPVISTECYVPIDVKIEPLEKRILLTLLCHLEARPGHLIVTPQPDAGFRFASLSR